MSKKIKSTPKAKVLTAVLIILFVGSCAALIFAICTGRLSRENNTTPTETATPVETTVAEAEPTVTTTASPETTIVDEVQQKLTFASEYKIDAVCDENGDEMDLQVAFGAHFREGRVEFEDDSFFISLPAQGKPDDYGGTYSILSETQAELRYDNSDIKSAFIKSVNDEGVITVVDVTMSSDFVITCVLP